MMQGSRSEGLWTSQDAVRFVDEDVFATVDDSPVAWRNHLSGRAFRIHLAQGPTEYEEGSVEYRVQS